MYKHNFEHSSDVTGFSRYMKHRCSALDIMIKYERWFMAIRHGTILIGSYGDTSTHLNETHISMTVYFY